MSADPLRHFAFLNWRSRANLALNTAERLLRASRPRSLPVHLDLVLTKACNLACVFCISYKPLREGQSWMDFGLYQRIARELFPRAASVGFCSGGEPLLYPRLREALALARESRTKTILVSNGTLLDRTTSRWMVGDRSLWELAVSLDGATGPTLARIRRGADLDLIVANLENLRAEKREARARLPKLFLRFTALGSNIRELPALLDLAGRVGASGVVVSHLKVQGEMDPEESLHAHPELAGEVFALARARARELGLGLSLPQLPGQPRKGTGPGRGSCGFPWDFCQIDPDGAIRPCYHSWLQRLGFFDQGFARVWQGDDYARLRQTLDSPRPHYPFCRFCPVRKGFGDRDSLNHQRPRRDYLIPGLEHLQTGFNRRPEESARAFRPPREPIREEER